MPQPQSSSTHPLPPLTDCDACFSYHVARTLGPAHKPSPSANSVLSSAVHDSCQVTGCRRRLLVLLRETRDPLPTNETIRTPYSTVLTHASAIPPQPLTILRLSLLTKPLPACPRAASDQTRTLLCQQPDCGPAGSPSSAVSTPPSSPTELSS
ncbi:hypothetical protein VTJ04DRAFT_6117 [Mycothermus thermophilus]|uniref:uncharacterized protein n=1 Tax=Humicola insolens TaxID=85995 RepID=UPI003743A0F3